MAETSYSCLIPQLEFCWSQKYKLKFYGKPLMCRIQPNLNWTIWSYQTPYTLD